MIRDEQLLKQIGQAIGVPVVLASAYPSELRDDNEITEAERQAREIEADNEWLGEG